MSIIEEAESTNLILDEHNKIIATLVSSEDKMFHTRDLLEKKYAYIEMIDKHTDENDYSIAKKLTKVRNSTINMVDMQNTKLRGEAKKVYDSCKEAKQCAVEIETDLGICEDKFGNLGNKLGADVTSYDEKINELIKLLDQLTEKRYKKLEYLENQQKMFLEEKLDLEKQNFDYAKQEEFLLADDEDDSELQALDNELEELQSKLKILDDEHCNFTCEDQGCKKAREEFTQKYDENKFVELEKRCIEINSEVSEIIKNLQIQKDVESEVLNSSVTLGEYEEKLNKELQDTSEFWTKLTESPYQGFSNIEQEISLIKSDITERNKKYEEVKNEDENCIEQIQLRDKEIESTSSITVQLSLESKEIENALGNLKSSDYMSEQHDIMTKSIENACIEKEKLSDICPKLKEEIENATTQMKKEQDKCELELLAMENNILMEIKNNEKAYAVADDANTNLEKKAQQAEETVKELEEMKKQQKEKLLNIEIQHKESDASIEQAQATLKRFKTEKEKLYTKLGHVAAPPPILLKERDQHFAKPKVYEVAKKRTVHKQSTLVKRNWDSDSSWEGEQKSMKDIVKKKYKKRSDQENTVN